MNRAERDRIKARAQELAVEKQLRQVDPPVKAGGKPAPGGNVPTRITFGCGHVTETMPCPACRAEKRRKGSTRYRAQQPTEPKGRLPDGAQVEAVYDHTKQCWAGTLTIPAPPHTIDGSAVRTFRDTNSALFRLLSSLDTMYRESLAEKRKG